LHLLQNNQEFFMSEFEHTLLDYVPVQEGNSPNPNTKILEALAQKAQQRGFQRPLGTDGIAVEFTIELPDDELENIPIPKFFIADRVCWAPLPGEEDEPVEGGCVIGMKYWKPGFSAPPVLPEWAAAEWQYLVYLEQNAPSRAWVQTDWAAETALILQAPSHSGGLPIDQEATNLEP
jgi:hypothetical protein